MRVWAWLDDGNIMVSPNRPKKIVTPASKCSCGDPDCSYNSKKTVVFSHDEALAICVGRKLFGKLEEEKLYKFELNAKGVK